MTNTDNRVAVGLAELAPWDDADVLENDEEQITEGEQQITEADIHELAAYGFDSDQQTLVGLGPVERARRARIAAQLLDGERMPQSEPPGPFIAADADDDVLIRSLRGRRLAPWAVALPVALVVAAAAVAVVRGFAPHPLPVSKPVVAAQAPQAAVDLPPKLTAVSAEPSKRESATANDPAETEGLPEPERLDAAPRSATAKVPIAAVAVTLPEQSLPSATGVTPGTTDASVGSLNVTSSPPANILLDGRPLGKAPRLVEVPPGNHTVLFIHPLYGRRELHVNVSAGQTANASAAF